MSKTLRFSLMLLCSGVTYGLQAATLESEHQKFSYTMGFQFGSQLAQSIKNKAPVEPAAFAAGIEDVLAGRDPKMSQEQMKEALQAFQANAQKERDKLAKENLEKGKKFLEENKSKAGVMELSGGLQYLEQRAGTGDSPAPDASVTVHYRGTTIDGREFDSSIKRGKPATFNLGGVVPGFREAITHMKPGAKWQVFMPTEMAYGAQGAGGAIGPNETLIFEIELISVEAKPEAKPAEAPKAAPAEKPAS